MNLLILFAGKHGTTKIAAQKVAQHFERTGHTARCMSVAQYLEQARSGHQADPISDADRVVIGTPVYYGKCPKEVLQLLGNHADILKQTRALFFFTCLRLTRGTTPLPFGDIHVDPQLAEPAKPYGRMGLMEKSHSISQYLDPLADLFAGAGISGPAFFKGNLDLKQLDFKSRVVMTLMIRLMAQVSQGDFLDTDAVCKWVQKRISDKP